MTAPNTPTASGSSPGTPDQPSHGQASAVEPRPDSAAAGSIGAIPGAVAEGTTSSSSGLATAPPPPALLGALARFERGDFRGVRQELDRLVPAAPPAEVPRELVAAARSLRGRLDIDPAGFVVGGIALGLLVLVSTTYLF
jgi:hypothetical protein